MWFWTVNCVNKKIQVLFEQGEAKKELTVDFGSTSFSKKQIIEHFIVQFSRTLADYQRLDDMVEALEASLNLRL